MSQEQSGSNEAMTFVGWLMIVGGLIYLVFAFNMDVSVSTSSTYVPGVGEIGGGRIANIDLISRRQNHLIVAALITLIGVLLAIFGRQSPTANASQQPLPKPKPQHFEGDRKIDSDPYRLWLVEAYAITRNEVFDRFVSGETTFATLDEALDWAHRLENKKLKQEHERQKKLEIDAEERREAARLQVELDDAEWQRTKPKVIVGALFVTIAIVVAIFMLRETSEERTARLAREEAARLETIEQTESKFGINLPNDIKGLKITENAADYYFLCDNKRDGTLIEFSTNLSKKAIKDALAKKLGAGDPVYAFMDDSFDWTWNKNGSHFELTMFSKETPTDVNLCVTTASN